MISKTERWVNMDKIKTLEKYCDIAGCKESLGYTVKKITKEFVEPRYTLAYGIIKEMERKGVPLCGAWIDAYDLDITDLLNFIRQGIVILNNV